MIKSKVMMLYKLRLFIAKILIYIQQKKSAAENQNINFEKAKTIGLIYQRGNKLYEAAVINIIRELVAERKKVYSMEYIQKNSDNDFKLKEKDHHSLHDEDINFFLLPKRNILKGFCPEHFDIIINLAFEDEIRIHHTVALCSASIKAGFMTQTHAHLYDLMLDTAGKKDYNDHIPKLINYLKQINKN